MEYRVLPRGGEKLGVIGMGLGGIAGPDILREEHTVQHAIDLGVNHFDAICVDEASYRAFGRAIRPVRGKVHLQVHVGPSYDGGRYAFCRDEATILKWFHRELALMGTDYADFGNIHCVDQMRDVQRIIDGGLLDKMLRLKQEGTVRHLMFSTHTPQVAHRFLDTGAFDLFMFSINPAYDAGRGGGYANGLPDDRAALYARAQAEGVGITVMKAFAAGQLLDARRTPLGSALAREQCIQYALDRPGVVSIMPGVTRPRQLDELVRYFETPAARRDYSTAVAAGGFQAAEGRCVYCNHCAPCPAGIDIGLANKYYDLAQVGDALAIEHYRGLAPAADACLQCGRCDEACPFGVAQSARMREIAAYFKGVWPSNSTRLPSSR